MNEISEVTEDLRSDKTHLIDRYQIRIQYGKNVPATSPITVIVMSTNSDQKAVEAVKSILADPPLVEICVVNTGKGSLKDYLKPYLEQITLIESSELQFPGGTRNIGIHFTKAPIVAFLAADCRITPNWLSTRIHLHGRQTVVSSALRPAPDANGKISRISWASYLATHSHRVPEISSPTARPFGLSYHRSILEMTNLFNEDVRTGEDSLINKKISTMLPIKWNPEVVTLHCYPARFWDSIKDQFIRGRRESGFYVRTIHKNRSRVALKRLKTLITTISELYRSKQGHSLTNLVEITPLYVLLTLFRVIGNFFPLIEKQTHTRPHATTELQPDARR